MDSRGQGIRGMACLSSWCAGPQLERLTWLGTWCWRSHFQDSFFIFKLLVPWCRNGLHWYCWPECLHVGSLAWGPKDNHTFDMAMWCFGRKCPKRGESKEWSFQKIQVEVACLFYLTWESLLPNAIGQSIQRSTQIEWRNRDLAFSWTRESDLLSSFYRSVPLVLSALAKGAGLHSTKSLPWLWKKQAFKEEFMIEKEIMRSLA